MIRNFLAKKNGTKVKADKRAGASRIGKSISSLVTFGNSCHGQRDSDLEIVNCSSEPPSMSCSRTATVEKPRLTPNYVNATRYSETSGEKYADSGDKDRTSFASMSGTIAIRSAR